MVIFTFLYQISDYFSKNNLTFSFTRFLQLWPPVELPAAKGAANNLSRTIDEGT
jgi:hypothetical protein